MYFLRSDFIRFCLVGCIGFVVDYSVLHLVHLKYNLLISRMISLPTAITVTWAINRAFTFKTQQKASTQEWTFYTILNLIGGAINVALFLLFSSASAWLHQHLIIPLAMATAFSLIFNYASSKYLVFQKDTIQFE